MNGTEGRGIPATISTPAGIIKTKALLATNRTIATSLSILEEVADEHEIAMNKLRDALPPEFKRCVDLAEFMSEYRFDSLRTRIIKTANDGRREIEETIDALGL